jgi:hypothetical protein
MGKISVNIILIFLVLFLISCSPTREASVKQRRGIMLLKTEEYAINKPYKPSNLKKKVHKKAQKSLLKRSYKIK